MDGEREIRKVLKVVPNYSVKISRRFYGKIPATGYQCNYRNFTGACRLFAGIIYA